MSKEIYSKNNNEIFEYYKEIDNNILKNLKKFVEQDKIFKNFIYTTIELNIYLFKKKKDKWVFKTDKQIKRDFITKKKTLLKKFATRIMELSKSEISEIDADIVDINSKMKLQLKKLKDTFNIYLKLNDLSYFDLFNNDKININDISNLNKLNFITDYTSKKKNKKSVNEYQYIAEYSN